MEQQDQQDVSAVIALSWRNIQTVAHGDAEAAGWWIHPHSGADLKAIILNPATAWFDRLGKALVAEKLALIHSEISEGMEGHRKGLMDDKLPHRKMLEVELADAIIRIGDLAGALGLDLGGAIAEKLEFNRQRPDHKLDARMATGGKSY